MVLLGRDSKRALVRIYSTRLLNVLKLEDALDELFQFLDGEDYDAIKLMNPNDGLKTLLDKLVGLEQTLWFNRLKKVCHADEYMRDGLNCSHIKDLFHFEMLLSAVMSTTELLHTLDPTELAERMGDAGVIEFDVLTMINTQMRINGKYAANCALLQKLPVLDEGWYWKFMALLKDTGQENLILRIDPYYEDAKTKHDQELVSSDGAFQAPDVAPGPQLLVFDPLTDSLAMLNNDCSAVAPTSRSNGSADGQPIEAENNAVDRYVHAKRKVEELHLRKYQEELLPHALMGSNVVICAPTGSGKTFVAVKIILDHLLSSRFKKVIFFVPTVNLVEQQCNVLQRFLPLQYRASGVKGGTVTATDVPKAQIVHNHHVLFMTPAILLNLLISSDDKNLRVRLTDFSLFIFDECHHTVKDHPYTMILMRYVDELRSNNMDRSNLPQIVGMTASLSVDKADSDMKARESILDMCARMDCQYLETIQKHTDELDKMVNVPKDEVVRVPSSYSTHPFSIHVQEMMIEIEKYADSLIDETPMLKDLPIKRSENRWKAEYTNWLFNLKHKVPEVHDEKICRDLTTYLEILTDLHKSLHLVGHVPAKLALNYLETIMENLAAKNCQKVDQDLLDLFNRKRPFLRQSMDHKDAAIVSKLKEILVNEYKNKLDSRTIVFVQTRELTQALEKFMTEDDDLKPLGAARLVGVNSAEKSGQTTVDQQKCLEKFRSGDHKVIVATSVAEEGLDVETCNLVVKYNYVTNETALIQRRGRGRAEASRSILLAQEGWIPSKELQNMLRESLMKKAIEVIRTFGMDYFWKEMEQRQDLEWKRREDERKKKDLIRQTHGNRQYLLKCKKCKATVCSSRDMRVINNGQMYVAVDPKIWSQLTDAPMEPRFFETMCHIAKLCCTGACRDELGLVIKYLNAYMPCLSICSLVMFDEDSKQSHSVRKWKKVEMDYFVVDSIEQNDIIRMIQAIKPPKHLDRIIDRWLREQTAIDEAAARLLESERAATAKAAGEKLGNNASSHGRRGSDGDVTPNCVTDSHDCNVGGNATAGANCDNRANVETTGPNDSARKDVVSESPTSAADLTMETFRDVKDGQIVNDHVVDNLIDL